jgi:hypothetical protein
MFNRTIENLLKQETRTLEQLNYLTVYYDFFYDVGEHQINFSKEEVKYVVSNLSQEQLDCSSVINRFVTNHYCKEENAIEYFVNLLKKDFCKNIDIKEMLECIVDNNINMYDKNTARKFIAVFHDYLSDEYTNKILDKIFVVFDEITNEQRYLDFLPLLSTKTFYYLLDNNKNLSDLCTTPTLFENVRNRANMFHRQEENTEVWFKLFSFVQERYSPINSRDVYLFLLRKLITSNDDFSQIKENYKDILEDIGKVMKRSVDYSIRQSTFFYNHFFINNDRYSSSNCKKKKNNLVRFFNVMSEFIDEKTELAILKSLTFKYFGYKTEDLEELNNNCTFAHQASTEYLTTTLFMRSIKREA